MTEFPDRPKIYSHVTRTRFLHLEDSLNVGAGKVRFFLGSYGKGNNATTVSTYHFLDAADARVLFSDISWGKPVTYTDYKGSRQPGGEILSRVLKIKYQLNPNPAKAPGYWIEIQNGEGEMIGEGAVKPKGKPSADVSIFLDTWEARKMAYATLAYMQAYQTGQPILEQITALIRRTDRE